MLLKSAGLTVGQMDGMVDKALGANWAYKTLFKYLFT